ncbi:MAG: hypothetical protein C0621_10720 [Desulfuromonas sp.]|nr:MAG: hypothetical protein C0621_10720 [Desulfuromonas sp.]
MESWLLDISPYLPSGAALLGLAALVSFLESLALIGILFPGSVLIVLIGMISAHHDALFLPLALCCAAGAILGDLVSYGLGARFSERLLSHRLMQQHQETLHRAELFFAEHGGKSVFFGRFVGFLRPFIPFIAGGTRMRPTSFTLYALVSGLLWGTTYPGLGYLFAASWEAIKLWSGRFSLMILILLVLVILNTLFWRRLAPALARLGRRLGQRFTAANTRLQQQPSLHLWRQRHPHISCFLARRFERQRADGLGLTLGVATILTFAASFLLFSTPTLALQRFDMQLLGTLQQLHHPLVDRAMLILTLLGNGTTILTLGALVLSWLLVNGRLGSTIIVTLGLGSGELLVTLTKALLERPRPEPLWPLLLPASASMPSGHAFTALLFYGLVAYLLLPQIKEAQGRFHLLLTTSLLVSGIALSRLYLGLHWGSDVLAGLSFGGLWLALLITLLELRQRYRDDGEKFCGWRIMPLSQRWRQIVVILVGGIAFWGVTLHVSSLWQTLFPPPG